MVKLSDGGDKGKLKDGVNGCDFVGKKVELVGGEFLSLLVEMELEGLGEFLLGVSGRGMFFTEADEFLSHVATFNAAGDTLREELESEGDKRCVFAAEDGRALEVGEGLGEEVLVEVVFGHGVDLALNCTSFGLNVRNDGLSVADDRLGTTEAGGEGEFLGGEFFFENIKGVVVRAGEAVDSLVAVTDGDETSLGNVYHVSQASVVNESSTPFWL